jgi:hypothetical protein
LEYAAGSAERLIRGRQMAGVAVDSRRANDGRAGDPAVRVAARC